MTRQTALAITCLILTAIAGHGQNPVQTIKGQVIDAATEEGLPFSTVKLSYMGQGVVTDSAGCFLFKDIPVGRYDLEASYVGYTPVIMKDVIVISSKETQIEIPLQEMKAELHEVVVTPKVIKHQPLNSMNLSSGRMLSVEEAGRFAGGLDDPARLAGAFAGVATNIGDNGITVRGNAPKLMQWKLEGVEIPNPNHFGEVGGFGGGGLTALSSLVLGNSDFLTGAFPAEYGNALAGVFDLKLRTGNNNRWEHTVSLGTMGIDLSSEGPFKKGGKSSYLFNYRYSTLWMISSFLPDGAGEGMKYQDLSLKLNFPTKKAGTFSVWALGLIDGNKEKPKYNKEEWEYESDRNFFNTSIWMGALGVNHKLRLNETTQINTTIAGTYNGIDSHQSTLDDNLADHPDNIIKKNNYNLVMNAFMNKRIGNIGNNRTGIVVTGMFYDMLLKNAPSVGEEMTTIANEHGNSALLEAYTEFSLSPSWKWQINPGVHLQYFALNGHYSIEPRVAIKYNLTQKQSLTFSYGSHSRTELLNYYFTRNDKGELINKDLDFTRGHHFVVSYDLAIGNDFHLRAEPYLQLLYKVPVVAGSSNSLLNNKDDWFITDKFESSGRGLNYGLEVTFEKYMSKGYYFMVTGSVFSSRYKGGDGVWRNTRYNRNYLFNLLGGKEWMVGKSRRNLFGANARITFRGGDRYTPILEDESITAQEVIFDERLAYSQQLKPVLWADFSVYYRINGRRASHEIGLKWLNATFYDEYLGHEYNFKTGRVEEYRDGICMPNLYYKISF
ncbi:MAG: carboxypeptidase-like regulatory domain-containing protein [Bacteroidales bacterium]|nr:carboxypeptidase-like regulatory domain-containing protein [Bacteroidales bacterium]